MKQALELGAAIVEMGRVEDASLATASPAGPADRLRSRLVLVPQTASGSCHTSSASSAVGTALRTRVCSKLE